jgi:hypothetical protein
MKNGFAIASSGFCSFLRVAIGLSGLRDCGGKKKLVSLKQFTMCDCSHRTCNTPSFNWRQRSPRHSRADRQRFARGAHLHGSNDWRGSARIVSSVFGEGGFRFGEWQHPAVACRKGSGAPGSTPRLRQRPVPVSQRWPSIIPSHWSNLLFSKVTAASLSKHHPGQARSLRAGQMITVRAGVTKLPEPQISISTA